MMIPHGDDNGGAMFGFAVLPWCFFALGSEATGSFYRVF